MRSPQAPRNSAVSLHARAQQLPLSLIHYRLLFLDTFLDIFVLLHYSNLLKRMKNLAKSSPKWKVQAKSEDFILSVTTTILTNIRLSIIISSSNLVICHFFGDRFLRAEYLNGLLASFGKEHVTSVTFSTSAPAKGTTCKVFLTQRVKGIESRVQF